MELRHLRYFVAMAKAPTMSKAAEHVFVTQSTLSHQLAQLEDELGCPLFDRVGRNLRLTDAGLELLGHAQGVLAQVDQCIHAVARAGSLASGTLRVGVIHSFMTSWMPEVCCACLAAHPQLKLQVLELTGPEIEAQVADGRLDLGIGFYPPVHDSVIGEKLFDDVLVLAVPRDHELANRKSVRFAQLGDVPLAMLGQRFATRRLIDDYFQRAGVRAQVVLEIDSVDALQRVVEQGAAAAFLPGRVARRNERMHLIDVSDPNPVRAAGMIWRRTTYRSAAAKAFSSVVAQSLTSVGLVNSHAVQKP